VLETCTGMKQIYCKTKICASSRLITEINMEIYKTCDITLESPFLHSVTAPSGPGLPHNRIFTITLRHTTVGETPLNERSARRRDLYLTTYNTHNREISMSPEGFETTVPASERPQSHAIFRTLESYTSQLHMRYN